MKGIGRIGKGRLVGLSAALALALAFGPALAAPINVPADFATIQAALDSANPGDTVVVAKSCGAVGAGFCGDSGVYHETLEIEDKINITLKCNGAVLDGAVSSEATGENGEPPAAAAGPTTIGGDGLHVHPSTHDFTVIGCTFQNFGDDGIDLHESDRARILNNTLVHNGSDGLEFDGDDFLIRGNKAINNVDDGFDITHDENEIGGIIERNFAIANDSDGFLTDDSSDSNFKFLRNRALRNHSTGFDISGDNHTFIRNRAEANDGTGFEFNDGSSEGYFAKGNLARGNDGDGFHFHGNDHTLIRNVAIQNADDGFELGDDPFDDNTVDRNISIGNESEGFDIDGDRNTITRNRAIENQGGGFDIDCTDGGDIDDVCTGLITKNRSLRNISNGFEINGFDDTTISRNRSIGNEDDGFDLEDINDSLVDRNLAQDNGEDGFEISDNDKTTYSNNRSIGNSEDGFRLSDSSSETVTLLKNTILRNDGDGIDIDDDLGPTSKIVLDGNRVIGNRGTGIENDNDAETSLKDNFMSGNRTDLAGKGDDIDTTPDPDECDNTAATDGPPPRHQHLYHRRV